jgi:hypothetical protein
VNASVALGISGQATSVESHPIPCEALQSNEQAGWKLRYVRWSGFMFCCLSVHFGFEGGGSGGLLGAGNRPSPAASHARHSDVMLTSVLCRHACARQVPGENGCTFDPGSDQALGFFHTFLCPETLLAKVASTNASSSSHCLKGRHSEDVHVEPSAG